MERNYDKTITKPKIVRMSRKGENITWENKGNITYSVFPANKATVSQSRQVFNQVINTLCTVGGWHLDEVTFLEGKQ